SGSEANDLPLSLSQAITGRSAIATRERAYHGMTGLSRYVTGQPHWHGAPAIPSRRTVPVPQPADVQVLPAPEGAPHGGGAAAAGAVCLSQRLVDQLEDKTWQTFSTFRGHRLMVATLRALVRVIEREGLVERVAALDGFMEKRLLDIAERHPSVARVDG